MYWNNTRLTYNSNGRDTQPQVTACDVPSEGVGPWDPKWRGMAHAAWLFKTWWGDWVAVLMTAVRTFQPLADGGTVDGSTADGGAGAAGGKAGQSGLA